MSLEEKLDRLAEAVEKNTEILTKIAAGKPGSAASGDGEKPKSTRGKKAAASDDGDSGGDDDAVDAEALKKTVRRLAGWLKEFAEDEDDPENDARNEKLAEMIKKLGVAKVSEVTTEKDRGRVEKWIDARIEEGRTTKKAGAKKAAADDEGDDL